LRRITWIVGWGERVGPCREHANLGTEGLPCLAVERGEHIGLGCPEPVIEGREELGAASRGDDPASSPVSGVRPALDEPGRFQVVEQVGHDCSIDPEVLGENKLAGNRALRRGGKDLITPRAAGKVCDRGMCGHGVCPQDHAQAPSEVARQRADAAGGLPDFVTAQWCHPASIIADKARLGRSSATLMICCSYSSLGIASDPTRV
jgi:hypothetical protein